MTNYSIIENSSESISELKEKNSKNEKKKEFHAYSPTWTMNEVVLNDNVRDSIEDAIAFCKNRKKIIEDWHFNRFLKGNGTVCINLYGEPGTGKTTTANAMVNAIGLMAVEVSLAEILGNLQGQTEQNLTALFKYAQDNNYIIIFNDADSMLSQRSTGTANSDSMNISKDHLLNLLDSASVIIIFTTNFMKSYDEAFKSRMLFNIGIALPNREERIALWKFHLDSNMPKSLSYEELADLSEGLSGRNIRQIAMTMGIRLTVGKINTIERKIIEVEVEKIKSAAQNLTYKSEKVNEKDLPKSISNHL